MAEDGPPLTADDVEAAASVGRLPALARQLVLDASWSSLEVLLQYARGSTLPLTDLEDTVRALASGAASLPESRRAAAAEELRGAKHLATALLLRRVERDPLTAPERAALRLAAELLSDLGEPERAAHAFERAGDMLRAAEAYGALGDLERMEECLRRDERARTERLAIVEGLRQFEMLVEAGERRAAMRALAAVPEHHPDGSSAHAQARDLARRLCRGRTLSLRLASGEVVRLASAPAVLGRDGTCQVPLRDPTVSRRHAQLSAHPAGFAVQDLGSRGGTRLGGALVGASLPLPPEGELGLGEHCRLAFRLAADGVLALTGIGGLDRGLRAFVAPNPLALTAVEPEARGLRVRLEEDHCRLERDPVVPVRVAGRLIGTGCDLVHGDVVEVAQGLGLRFEVP